MAMQTTDQAATLLRFSDSELELADRAMDIRSRDVVDMGGEKIGDVSDLFVDEAEKRVRFIEVASGGFLGLGATKFLIPVEAIQSVGPDTVHINQSQQFLKDAPSFDPQLIDQRFLDRTYGYYGHSGYWTPGYTYPRWY